MGWAGPILRAHAVVVGTLVFALVLDGLDVAGAGRVLLDIVLALVAAALAAFVLRSDLRGVLAVARIRRPAPSVSDGA